MYCNIKVFAKDYNYNMYCCSYEININFGERDLLRSNLF